MKRWHFIVILIGAVLLTVWASGGFKPAEKAPATGASYANPTQPAPTVEPEVKAPAADPVVAEVEEVSASSVLNGLDPITVDSGVEVFTTVSRTESFEPQWPEGTNQTSVGYSNPEEYADGRTFWTRNPVNEDEILAFVAQCVQINGGEKICMSENAGAIVGYIVAGPDGEWPVTLWDAELKTLIIPGGHPAWQAFVNELAEFISSNKGGIPVEILGPAK